MTHSHMSPEEQQFKFRRIGSIVLFGVLMGLLYVLIQDGLSELFKFINGGLVGLILGLFIGYFEYYFAPKYLNYRKFTTVVFVKTLTYSFVISVVYFNVLVISRMIKFGASYSAILHSGEFTDHMATPDFKVAPIFIIVVALFINATLRISRRFGQENLLDIIYGTYNKPKVKYRMVMFLKIQSAPKIIEKLGMDVFYNFLNDYYYDITDSVLHYKAHIYQYFNEELVLSWDINKGIDNANVVRFYFGVLETLQWRKEHYLDTYGFLPRVSAGVHCGELVISEVGDIKTDVVLSGDLMNTTARIAGESIQSRDGLLLSRLVYRQIDLPNIFRPEEHGPVSLRGKSENVDLIEIKRADV